MAGSRGNVGIGLLIGLLATIVGLILCAVLSVARGAGVVLYLGIGVGQALWMVPVCLHFKSRGEIETVKGVLIVAGLVFLLNATCWGVLMSSKLNIH